MRRRSRTPSSEPSPRGRSPFTRRIELAEARALARWRQGGRRLRAVPYCFTNGWEEFLQIELVSDSDSDLEELPPGFREPVAHADQVREDQAAGDAWAHWKRGEARGALWGRVHALLAAPLVGVADFMGVHSAMAFSSTARSHAFV